MSSLRSLIALDGCVPRNCVADVLDREGSSVESLMLRLLPLASRHSDAPISRLKVGAVALGSQDGGEAGAIYLGSNCEFPGTALATTIHAEQSAVNNAWLHGESGIRAIAVSAAPCGHCRQFLSEISTAGRLEILVAQNGSRFDDSYAKYSLQELLPAGFGPNKLGITNRLLKPAEQLVAVDSDDPLVLLAAEAARRSYAPYTGNLAGVALQLADGSTVCGRIAENAAFNPTLSPMASALAVLSLRADVATCDVTAAALVEVPTATSQRQQAEQLLRCATGQDLALQYFAGHPG
jgi:cytidine deaminase